MLSYAVDQDSCSSGPCLNGGTCINAMGLDTFICECLNTHTGPTCDTGMNAHTAGTSLLNNERYSITILLSNKRLCY